MIIKKSPMEFFFENKISKKQLNKIYGKGDPKRKLEIESNTNPNEPDGEGGTGPLPVDPPIETSDY